MGERALIADDLRHRIMSEPDVILEDLDLMRALIAGNDKTIGGNVVDLRSIAMERLEARLDRLEDTHRNVIAAAYENLSGTNQIHRAVLAMLDPTDFEAFLHNLATNVADILRVDALRLVLETEAGDSDSDLRSLSDVLSLARPGFISGYLTHGRNTPERRVTLRQCDGGDASVYGSRGGDLHSEACLKLDFGSGRLPGLLVLASEDPHLFTPAQGTDLLGFFAGAFERSMRRWLA
ncbi:DUF484 family protein [Oceaniglobus indicus]|uniref:DUF484 family protein n=1 Tax=Oceaniglobus indicus TaxID=2047749 RepID=UPI000C175073|nr:DUF484 family protein [Oceaniglobus indicus]